MTAPLSRRRDRERASGGGPPLADLGCGTPCRHPDDSGGGWPCACGSCRFSRRLSLLRPIYVDADFTRISGGGGLVTLETRGDGTPSAIDHDGAFARAPTCLA